MTLGPNMNDKYWGLDTTPTRIDSEVSVALQCVSTPFWLFPPESYDPPLAGWAPMDQQIHTHTYTHRYAGAGVLPTTPT